MIKCVIWDIDNTLLAGTYLEAAGPPPAPDPGLLAVARELDGRGIVHALASKNPPEAADYVARATGLPFAAAECGWGRKSEAIGRIIDDLGLAADAVAFVDDEMLERAEVAAALPDVLVLTPEDAAEAVSWPEFSPAVITAEGRRRGEMYAQRRRRQEEARAFGGSRDDFLAYAGTEVLIAPAGPADLPRLHELTVRTHQFNTGAEPVTQDRLAAALADPGQRLVAVWLRDRFGDDGLVGGAWIDLGDQAGVSGPAGSAEVHVTSGAGGPGTGGGPGPVVGLGAVGRGPVVVWGRWAWRRRWVWGPRSQGQRAWCLDRLAAGDVVPGPGPGRPRRPAGRALPAGRRWRRRRAPRPVPGHRPQRASAPGPGRGRFPGHRQLSELREL